jgi:hypothetical protein
MVELKLIGWVNPVHSHPRQLHGSLMLPVRLFPVSFWIPLVLPEYYCAFAH